MNQYQRQLWTNLQSLVKNNEAFYCQENKQGTSRYLIFNYRLASYTDFLQPSAMECRGIMFEVDEQNQPIRLVCLPIEKFFNLNENPATMNVDLTNVCAIDVKMDGSLISTYIHNGQLKLKSKGSITSEQCVDAMKWLDRPENATFKTELFKHTHDMDCTVNLEWTSPLNRIVLGYDVQKLTVLNVRNMLNGQYFYDNHCPTLAPYWVDQLKINDPVSFVQGIPKQVNIEGYVVRLWNGQRIKIKTEWYLSLHHAKDSVNNPRRLFEAILDEGIDDLRSLFSTDVVAMQMIDEMQLKVNTVYNGMVKMVEDFYESNKHLDRKDYALLGQKHFAGTFYFGIAMLKYTGKPVNYKETLKGKWKDLGLKDTSIKELDENS